jgi:hypothetical protein
MFIFLKNWVYTVYIPFISHAEVLRPDLRGWPFDHESRDVQKVLAENPAVRRRAA